MGEISFCGQAFSIYTPNWQPPGTGLAGWALGTESLGLAGWGPAGGRREPSGSQFTVKCLGASGWSSTDSLNAAKCMVAPEGAGFNGAWGRGRGYSPPGGVGQPGGEG